MSQDKPFRDLEEGTLAYDIGQTPHSPVIVTDPDVGTIGDQKPAKQEQIRDNEANQSIGFDLDTQCVDVMFFDLSSRNKRSYTYPITRIGVPRIEILEHELTPKQYAQFLALKDLIAESMRSDGDLDSTPVDLVETVKFLWSSAGLDGDVLDTVEETLDESLEAFTDDT